MPYSVTSSTPTNHFAQAAREDPRAHPLGHSPTRAASKCRRVREKTQQQYNDAAAAEYVAAMMKVDLHAALTLMKACGPTSYHEVANLLGVPVDLLLARLKHHLGSRLPVLD